MFFKTVATALVEVGKVSSRNKMTELLADLFDQATPAQARMLSYIVLGVLHAPYEKNQFNFAEKSMLKLLAQILGVEVSKVSEQSKVLGDLGIVVMESPWPGVDKELTVDEVYDQLEQLLQMSGTGSQEAKAALLGSLLLSVDQVSAAWIVRMVLGSMRLGFSDMTLLDAYSWMITKDKSLKSALENGYNVCADIGLIIYLLKSDGIQAVQALQPTLGIPIRPAAAERAEGPAEIIERLGPCVAQPKLDGFRVQIHIDKSKGEYKTWFFSRNLQDMSAMFPDLVAALAHVPVESVIMEGEAIVYDEETGTFLPFQETVKRKRKHGIEEVAQSLPLRLFLFDILYLNGRTVMSLGHEERRALLLDLFKNYPDDTVQVIQEQKCTTVQELTNYFNQNITHGLEGIVVKRPDAAYQPGKRNFNWIKLKRHEEGHLVDTIDCVILGYYAGRGKRAAFGVGAFLVGIYNEQKNLFETVAKIGTGMTDEEWIDVKKQCDQKRVESKPVSVSCAPELYPDVWVEPAITVIIRADEITQSPMHTAGKTDTQSGLALRFPRFMGYTLDKNITQITTVNELRRLYGLQYQKK